MAKQLNVNLTFTADTAKAKAQLRDLQSQLDGLINGSGTNRIAGQINEATKAAAELKIHLQNATNIKTGNLDFTKLNESIKQSGKSLVQYGEQLNSMGPQGQKAFMALAQSVSNAEVPIRRANTALTEMATTLKNTVRWQISSSILHGFMGTIQSAYGYAQDLNESLNNIRIVTGQNVDQMARFANEANKAAKALSTTTTAYTDAALIYYQQGLDDTQVKQRTDITIKMANVSRQSAEEVSDQMTAVWNNFYDGSQSLEHFADVMTRLGADTASSSDEIAQGLEKFAAIADMIGLSFDNAAAALATVTATTRQSADVVGTAFKTIFARIQGLSLGETLDDGTNLNKYSKALEAVGISIKQQNGELKDMDSILAEMGAKWDTLSKDQQVALAQTVAGVRQYNQLIALMDNFDFYQKNLNAAQNSNGSLQEQADIYAESWEAASKKVRAALESIYSTLIDDKSFIDILNIIEKIITYFDNLIDTVGGLSGVLTALGAILTKVFSNQLAQSISNMAYSIKMMFPSQQAKAQTEKSATIKEFADIMASSEGSANSTVGQTASQVYTEKLNLQEKMISNANRMSEAEKQQIQILMDQLSIQEKQTIEAAKQVDIAKNKKSDAASKIYMNAAQRDMNAGQPFNARAAANSMANVATSSKSLNSVSNILKTLNKESDQFDQQLHEITQTMQNMANQNIGVDLSDDLTTLKELLDVLRNTDTESEDWVVTLQQIQGLFGAINQEVIENTATETNSEIDEVNEYSQAVIAADNAVDRLKQSQDDLSTSNTKVGQSIDQAQGKIKTWADSLVSFANGALSIVSALQMVGGIVDTLENPDMSTWEKVLSIGSSILMMTTMLVPTFTALTGAFGGTGAAAVGATGPIAGFGAALNTALGPIGWVTLALTALVAVFAVIVTSLDTVSEKAQKKFNQMAEDAQHATDALNEAENSYNNLQDTINSYNEARDNIDSLTQGTEEFKNAVLEANDAARELIELYGIASRYNANTGLIEIDTAELDKAIELEQIKLENARIASIAAQSNKTMAASDLSNAKAAEKDNKSWMELASNDISLGAIGGIVTTIMAATAGIGTPIAAAVAGLSLAIGALNGTFEYMNQNSDDQKQISALEALQDAYIQSGGNFEIAMDSLSESEKSLIDSLGMTDDELTTLCSEVSANTAAVLQNNKQLIDSNFTDNKEYQNSKHKDQLNTLMADELARETDRIYDEVWADKGKLGNGKTDKEAQQAYAEMMGYTWVKDKGDNLGVYSKGDGSADFTISDETARRALAQKDAMEALGKSVEKYNETLETVNKTGEKFGNGVGDLMLRLAGGQGASFADATSTEIEALQNAINGAKIATDIISNEDAQNMGYDNAEAYVKALQLGIDSYKDGLNNVGKNLSSSISTDFLNGIEELTLAGAQSMAGNLDEAFKLTGSKVANTLDDIFVRAGEDADELSTLLEGVDWGDPNAIAKLNAKIKEQGLNVDISSTAWKTYTEAMSAAGMAIGGVQSKFDALRDTIASTSNITKNLQTNSIISDEDYEKLLDVNPAIKEMFMITADGYRFLGSKGDLDKLLIGNAKEDIAGVKEEFATLSEEGEALTKINWFNDDGSKAFSSDRHVAMIADYASDDTSLDGALAYMGVSKESLQEAADYILDFTDEQGNILTDKDGFDKAKYDEYVQLTQDVYTQLGNIRQQYLDGDFSAEQAEQLIASTATNIAELQQLQADGAIGAEAFNQQLNVLTTEAFNAAQSLDELKGALQLSAEMGGEIDYTAYADNLMRIANGYENCAKEIEAYQLALANGEGVEEAQAALETAVMIGEAAEKYGLEAKEVEVQARQLAKAYDLDAEAAAKLAINNQRMNKGIITLAENWKNWSKALKASDKTSLDWADAAVECTAAIADLVGASEDLELPDEFFNTENMALLEKAINGDTDAINRLGAVVAAAQVEMIEFNESFADLAMQTMSENGLEIDITLDSTQFDADKILVLQGIDDIKNGVLGASSEMDAEWVAALNRMALTTGMSVDDMNSLLGSLGVQAKVETTYVKQPMEVPTYTDVVEPGQKVRYQIGTDPDTQEPIWGEAQGVKKYTVPGEPLKVEGFAAVAQISTEDNPMTAEIETNTVSPGSKPSSGATYTGNRGSVAQSTKNAVKDAKNKGGGKEGKKNKGVKKDDTVDRYKEIEDALDDMADALEDANKETDRLFGAARLNSLKKENNLILQNIELLKKKKTEAEANLEIDRKALKEAANAAGITLDIDENNLITNYTEAMTQLFNELDAAHKAAGDTIEEAEQEVIDAIQEKIDLLKEAIAQFDKTRELLEDTENEIQDAFYKWQDNNYEQLSYELELKIDIEDAALKRLDYFLNKFSDDFYKMAESAALMQNQIPTYKNLIGSYDEYKTSLDTAYSKGKISQADYIEGLKQVRDGIYEQLEALNELDKQMLHYYEDTLSAATDELADHTDHMEHLTSVFEHYQNLLSIIGKSKDYEAMGNFLQGQADTIKDRLSVAQSYYDVLLQQKDEIQAELEAAIKSGDEAKIEMYQKEWDAIVDETDAAQEQVLSLTEEWAEAMKSVIQNNMEKIADTLEKTLTGGTTFDTLMDGFDKLNTRQEEYLTKTNQIYETNKLMRTASKALDETDNKVAKQKLKNFIDETKGLQETTQLSKYELEIQQAKYDLLLAQIALEEAQNAQSTVRLSRDNEGNFGYVYTADQNKIDDAQQAVDDADNSLYNLSLEGQQQYTEKYLQAQQSMYEELKQLQQDYLDGNIASEEEYERIKEQILNHYLGPDGVLTTYQNLYNVAVRTDANATADYWGQEYGRMTQDTEAWKTAVNDYLLEIDDQINEWKNVQTIANQEVEGALSNSKKATEELTEESEKLKDTINDEVIPTISDEIDAVKEQTDAYAAQRAELQALINTYENYLNALDATISANSIGFDKNTDYSALMNEYLNSGGKTSDKAFQDLLKQRNAKIEWLESDAGGNKGSEYWGTKGADTLAYYETLTSGGGSEEQRAWFEKDYMTKDEMLDKLNNLGISTEELELAINEVKASTDTVGEKITETGNNTNTKLEEVGNNTNSKIEETNNNTNSKIDETKDNLNTSINDSKDTLNTSIESNRDETVTSLGDINNTIENRSDEIIGSIGDAASDIIGSIGSAASEISSSVGGAISSIRSEISSLRGSVTGATIGSIAGPIGTAIGGVIGGAIGKAKRYDTGGYTGDWGPEGKLAILDQKELVLNQNDTQNLLSTVSLIRELVSMIDAQAANASLFNLMSSPSPNTNTNTLEQKVEITAEFPNVNDRYEIEEAFNNLVNRASQYANKAF